MTVHASRKVHLMHHPTEIGPLNCKFNLPVGAGERSWSSCLSLHQNIVILPYI